MIHYINFNFFNIKEIIFIYIGSLQHFLYFLLKLINGIGACSIIFYNKIDFLLFSYIIIKNK